MRWMVLALAAGLACDSGGTKVAVAPPPAAPASAEALGGAPSNTAPNNPPLPASAGSNRGGSNRGGSDRDGSDRGGSDRGGSAGSSDARSEGEPGCRFQRPEIWAGGRVAWLGACKNGFAQGSGVLINTVEGAEPERFYGQLDGGLQTIGVLQSENGFIAGRWNHGTVVPALPDDRAQRNVIIDAFQAAASAATAASKSFAKKSDAKASRFYAQQARLLREQMD